MWRETPRRKIKNNKRTKESIRSDWTRRNQTKWTHETQPKVKMVRKKIGRSKREENLASNNSHNNSR